MQKSPQHYLGNPLLKAAYVKVGYTLEQGIEIARCQADPVYFLENYGKVVSLDKGTVPFILYPYQKRLIKAIDENNAIIGKLFRQAGKSTVIAGYIAWYVLFNPTKTAAILANKAAIAKEIFSRVQFFIENIPFWLQQGVIEWNKTSFQLENGSKCFCAASSPSAIRGMSVNLLLCDEFAHMPPNLADEFIASVFPTVSSAETSKLILISTPNGLNHYYKMWDDATKHKNGFVAIEGKWQEHPSRNQEWADKMLAQLGIIKYRQEVECSFEGSAYTLIDGVRLSAIPFRDPLYNKERLSIYAYPEQEKTYVMSVDTSRGQHLDYSAFVVFDITERPYKIVATFKDNEISSSEYPFLIRRIAEQYNQAYILVEVNDIGGEVANTLWYEYEYEHIYFTPKADKLSTGRGYPGVRTTKRVKAIGCSTLKEMIERDQLEIPSFEIIQELSVFVQKKASYGAADEKINDDLTSCLWLFAWLSKQPLFSDLNDTNTRKALAEKREQYIMDNMLPMGFLQTGIEEVNPFDDIKNNSDDAWIFTTKVNPDDDFKFL